jgi:arsenite-transporting ATPase
MLFPTEDDGSVPNVGTRVLLFTGKGGVGKTTCAAATALRAAQQGKKTLILSSDPAHSLADALDRDLGPEAQEVQDRLFAQEVDLYYSMKKYWGNMRDLMLTVFRWQGVDQIAAEEMAALPGMNEGSVLLWLEQAVREEDYDLIVVDSAPTGETLTLLTLPQVTQWWLAKPSRSRSLPSSPSASACARPPAFRWIRATRNWRSSSKSWSESGTSSPPRTPPRSVSS